MQKCLRISNLSLPQWHLRYNIWRMRWQTVQSVHCQGQCQVFKASQHHFSTHLTLTSTPLCNFSAIQSTCSDSTATAVHHVPWWSWGGLYLFSSLGNSQSELNEPNSIYHGKSPTGFCLYISRSLCQRWSSKITEQAVVKLTLKNINPKLASQLRGNSMTTVEALVHLGQLLEKDRETNVRMNKEKNGCKNHQSLIPFLSSLSPTHLESLKFTAGAARTPILWQPVLSISLEKTGSKDLYPNRRTKTQDMCKLILLLIHSQTLEKHLFPQHHQWEPCQIS